MMKKNKIIYLSHSDIRFDSRILKEMQSAHDSGNLVQGIGINSREKFVKATEIEHLLISSISLFSRKLVFLPKSIRHFFSMCELTIKMGIFAMRTKPDLIHCNDTVVLPVAVIVKILAGAKLVYDAHELESKKNGVSRFLGFFILFTEKVLWHFVDGLIVVGPSIQRWYLENIGEKASVVVLNSPVIKKVLSNKTNYLREKFKIPDHSKIFIYIGLFTNGRGIDLTIDALNKTDASVSVVFLGYGEKANILEQLSAKHYNVHVHEAVPHDQVVSIAKSADFGLCLIENVSLSDYFSLPNKLFEYVFAEIPVLASDFPDISYFVNRHKLGLCVSLDVDSIAQGFEKICNNELHFSIDAKELVEYGWNAQANKLTWLYSELLKSK